MKRAAAIVILLWGALTGVGAGAQVKVTMPQNHYQRHDLIDVSIVNKTARSFSLCVEVGHWSFSGEGVPQMETTPTPVYVQASNGRRWSTLIIGPDIGSSRVRVALEPKQTQHYPFRLSDRGTMRILVDYWVGEDDHICQLPRGQARQEDR